MCQKFLLMLHLLEEIERWYEYEVQFCTFCRGNVTAEVENTPP